MLGGRRLLVYGVVVVGDPGRRSTSCCRRSPASRTRCARSRTPTRSGSRSRSGFNLLSFAAYIALFRGIVGGRRRAAAGARAARLAQPRTRSRSPAWPRRGCSRPAAPAASRSPTGRCAAPGWRAREAASRMVAFLVLLYTVYLLALVVCGIFLRVGLFPGPSPVGMTIVPAALAGRRADRAVPRLADPRRLRARGRALGAGPPARAAGAPLRERPGDDRDAAPAPRCRCCATRAAGCSAIVGAVGFWAANIAVLWACFHAFGESGPEGGAGPGILRRHDRQPAAVLPGRRRFGGRRHDRARSSRSASPASTVFVAVLAYRVIAFWLPIPPGIAGLHPAAAHGRPLAGGGRSGGAGRPAMPASRLERGISLATAAERAATL